MTALVLDQSVRHTAYESPRGLTRLLIIHGDRSSHRRDLNLRACHSKKSNRSLWLEGDSISSARHAPKHDIPIGLDSTAKDLAPERIPKHHNHGHRSACHQRQGCLVYRVFSCNQPADWEGKLVLFVRNSTTCRGCDSECS